jgi:hypothetical protein
MSLLVVWTIRPAVVMILYELSSTNPVPHHMFQKAYRIWGKVHKQYIYMYVNFFSLYTHNSSQLLWKGVANENKKYATIYLSTLFPFQSRYEIENTEIYVRKVFGTDEILTITSRVL